MHRFPFGLGQRFNIRPVLADTVGVQVVGWFTDEIRSLADLEGKNMHMPAVMGHIMEQLGALGFNLDVWNSFTPDQQRIIRETSMAHNSYAWAESTARNAAAMRALQREHDVRIMQFPEEVMIRMCKFSGDFVREMAETDDFSKRVIDSYMAYRDEALDWSEETVAKFIENRRLPFRYFA